MREGYSMKKYSIDMDMDMDRDRDIKIYRIFFVFAVIVIVLVLLLFFIALIIYLHQLIFTGSLLEVTPIFPEITRFLLEPFFYITKRV